MPASVTGAGEGAHVVFDRHKGHAQLALLSVLLAYLSFCCSPSSVMGLFCATLVPPKPACLAMQYAGITEGKNTR